MNDAKADAKAIFLEALDCKGADERMRFLEQACGPDAALRTRVEELMRAHRDAGAFLGGAENQNATRDQPIAERPGTVIGPYKLLQQIGEGGMGVVWMAEQTQPVQRKVALKVIKPGMDSRQVIARFEAERQALAMMDHVNIARVFDGGATEAGRPYFVMELVHGVPITKYCDDNHLTPRERLELFVPVCQAIQHALAFSGANAAYVGAVEGSSPLRKIGGLARILALSRDGTRLATVQPGGSLCLWDVDTGKRLHEFCHASKTYDLRIAFSADGKTLAFSDTDWIRLFDTASGGERHSRPGHRSPVKSVRFSSDGRTLISIGRDLLWRWHAATGKPICSLSTPEVYNQGHVLAWSNDGRFHAVQDEGGIALCHTGEPARLARKLDSGESRISAARFSNDGHMLSVAGPQPGELRFNLFEVPSGKVLGRGKLANGSLQNEWSLPAVSPNGKHIAWLANDGRILLADYAGEILRELRAAGNQRGAEDMAKFAVASQLLAFSPDGRHLFSAYRRDVHSFGETPGWAICMWEVSSGKEAPRLDVRLPNGGPGCVACVAFSPDGATLAVGQYSGLLGADDSSPNPPITLWEVASGRMRLKLEGHRRPVTSLAFAPDGRTLASGSEDGTALLWDLPRGSVPAAEMTTQRAETHWAELAGDDATLAYKAVWSLSAAPKFALPLLKRHLQPVPVISQEPIRKLVSDLGSDDFTIRDQAARELEKLGESAAPAFTKALTGKTSLEARRRVELLLAQVDKALSMPNGERRRLLRALEILARIGGADAIQLLQIVATGDPHARLSQEAQAALDRLCR